MTNLKNKKYGEKHNFSIWEVVFKHTAWRAAQQDSESDNERQFHFLNFFKEMSFKKIKLGKKLCTHLQESDLPKNLLFHEKSCVIGSSCLFAC